MSEGSQEPRAAAGAAFFDLDRTLIRGSSMLRWAVAAWRAKMMPGRPLIGAVGNGLWFRLTGGDDDMSQRTLSKSLELVAGTEAQEMSALADHIIPALVADVRSESQTLLDMHREAGRDRYVVSASPREIVQELATALDLEGVIATEAARDDDDRYTGELAAPFVYGPAKADAVRKLAAERGYDLRLCYAYSDSSSDLPMLELVGHPVAVNPDRTLQRIARTRGWPVVEFRNRAVEVTKFGLLGGSAAGGMFAAYFVGRRHGRAQRRWL